MLPGTGDPHVQQPAFLIHGLGRVGKGNRHEPLAQAHQEHGVPFQALGRVQRRQGDTLDPRGMLRGCTFLEFGNEILQRKDGLGVPGPGDLQFLGQRHQGRQ